MLVLYKNDSSPPARATIMLLHLLGIEYKGHDMNPVMRDQDTPEMTKVNTIFIYVPAYLLVICL